MKKKILLGMLAIMLLITGCGKVPKLKEGKEAVVSLNKGGISVDDLYTKMKDKYALGILIDMMDEKILSEKYSETDEEKNYVTDNAEQVQMFYDYYASSQYATYEVYLMNEYGVRTTEELKQMLSLSYKRNQAIEDYAKDLVADSEINKYYEEKVAGKITASHILITADYAEGATEQQKTEAEAKALETAKEVITKLNNGGDFATLAKEYSKDGSASNGGALGEFDRGDMVEPFYEAALALNVNEYSKEPVKSQFGYHIILKTAQAEKPSLDAVKEEVIETLAEEKLNADNKLSYEALISLREENGMKIEDKDLKEQYENYVYNVTNQ